MEAGLAPSSRKVYASAWKRYTRFATEFDLSPSPITAEKVILFVAFLGTQGLSPSTIESYLAGLRRARILADPSHLSPSFHTPYVKLLLRGIARSSAHSTRTRLPITQSIMNRIKSVLAQEPRAFANLMLWAACCVGFFDFLRCSEFLVPDGIAFDPEVHLAVNDLTYVTSTDPPHVELRIKASKTDQLRRGTTISLGSTRGELCPVAALFDYLNARGGAPGPLFVVQTGHPFTRAPFVAQLQQVLNQAGLPGNLFNGHSFRIGAATTASQVGIPETTIKILGRWNSTAYQTYIRPSSAQLAQVTAIMAGGSNTPFKTIRPQ